MDLPDDILKDIADKAKNNKIPVDQMIENIKK